MSASTILVLIGLRLSGKSTLGPIAARQLGLEFVDLDDAVLTHLGATNVTDAFRLLGEHAWRAGESAELARLLGAKKSCVLSLGGGTPMASGAEQILRQAQARGEIFIALLDPGESELAMRLANNRGDRPPLPSSVLTGDARADAATEVRALFESRMPLYRALANVIVDTKQSQNACVEKLVSAFQ